MRSSPLVQCGVVLLALGALVYAIGVIAGDSHEAPRLSTVSDAIKLGNFLNWRHVRTFGDERGPFNFKGAMQMWGGSGSKVWYYVDGERREYGLDEFFGEEVLVGTFENEKGNALALVFVRDGESNAPRALAAPEPD